MMEQISNQGNGVYAFVDSWREATRQMVQQLAGNLLTVAKDVKIQVEFNPQQVLSYRLLGYENRIMAAEDFNNDQKDAGEIGAGHRVTALYEIVPVGTTSNSGLPPVDELRYQSRDPQSQPNVLNQSTSEAARAANDSAAEFNDELLAVKLRYKQPEGDKSELLVFPLKNSEAKFNEADRDFRWAASIAQFGMLLRNSPHAGNSSWRNLIEQAAVAAHEAGDPHREEGVQMMRRAAELRRGR
jgi:Ca-activated chloride channel family protein